MTGFSAHEFATLGRQPMATHVLSAHTDGCLHPLGGNIAIHIVSVRNVLFLHQPSSPIFRHVHHARIAPAGFKRLSRRGIISRGRPPSVLQPETLRHPDTNKSSFTAELLHYRLRLHSRNCAISPSLMAGVTRNSRCTDYSPPLLSLPSLVGHTETAPEEQLVLFPARKSVRYLLLRRLTECPLHPPHDYILQATKS